MKHIINRKRLRCTVSVFAVGAIGYTLLELLWRGRSHWTMSLTGGTILCLLYKRCKAEHSLLRFCLWGAAVITTAEFFVGVLVNRLLHWRVWDYSRNKGNLLGQICPLYSSLWFCLCLPLYPLLRYFQKTKKYKRV